MFIRSLLASLTVLLLSAAVPVAFATMPDQGPEATALVKDLTWRNIGPANMAGRVSDIEAVEANPAIVFVAAASGGVFKSTNAGTTWTPVFDRYGSASIGDIAIFQRNPDIVWVGTGEACVRNSVAWGDGIYKSTDGGATFTNVGLRDTHHIDHVLTHPTDPDTVYVAAQGHLWAHTGERGIFKTMDGGRTWQKLAGGLPDDGRTGATDITMDPSNPNILYAAFWERQRQPDRFSSGGPNGGIFKSVNGGRTWTKLTTGLPSGPTGRIGLSIFRRNPKVVVAIVEHGFQPPRDAPGRPSPDYADMTKLGSGIYRTADGGRTWQYVNRYNNRPFYYSHIYVDPHDDRTVYVLAGTAQVSEDGGKTFARTLDGISGDFHALWIDPNNRDRFYVGNDKGAYVTYDRGQRFIMFDNMAIGQFYAVTLDNRDPYWVYGGLQDNGNWGGPSNSRDVNGIFNDHWFKFHSGDGFHTTVDPSDWRTVYTESQGGNIRRNDAVFRQAGRNITPTPATITNFRRLFPDYHGSPDRLPGPQFRFNWSAALTLSPHDPKTVLFGGNYVFRSTDRGDTWTIISPDLTTNDPIKTNPESGGLTRDVTAAETHCTIITLAESPVLPGVIWAGTDDGNVQVTRDGGGSWVDVRRNITGVPDGTWVSRVTPSRFHAGTTFVTFDGHRRDDFKPYVFKTTDFGRTWTSLAANLPGHEPVYVITEDTTNANLLFVGTEFAPYFTLDAGASWQRLTTDLPTVAVHDLVVHPRDGDLVAATHGRSVWILDDITPLQQMTRAVMTADAHLFAPRPATIWRGVSRGAERGHLLFMGRNPLTIRQLPPANSPPELENSAALHFHLGAKAAGDVTLEIADLAGTRKRVVRLPATPGLHRYYWDLRFDAAAPAAPTPSPAAGEGTERRSAMRQPQAGPGTYIVRLTAGNTTTSATLVVRQDPGLELPR